MKDRLAVWALGLVLFSAAFIQHRPPPLRSGLLPHEPAPPISEYECAVEIPCDPAPIASDPSAPIVSEEGPLRQTRSTVIEVLMQLARMQNADGSWGRGRTMLGDQGVNQTGLTGLAVVSFIKEGYSHLSKDDYDDLRFGDVVKKGLKWFLQNQRDDGTFAGEGNGPVDQFLATWALSEAYGNTATQLFLEPAQRSVDATSRAFLASLSRGDDSSAIWGGFALTSARLSELEIPDGTMEAGLAYFGARLSWSEQPVTAAGWSILWGSHGAPGLRPAAERAVQQPPDFEQPDLLGWYLKSAAFERCRGSDRKRAEYWGRRARESTSAAWARAKDLQSWNRSEDVVRASLLAFNLEYRDWPDTACDCCKSPAGE